MLAAWVTKQLVFDGAVNGMVIGLIALGIVLVYRSTRVINFAVGNMGLVGAGLLAVMGVQYKIPFWVSLPVAIAVGTLYAGAVEMVVIRRLFNAPRVIVLVGTIGIAQLALSILTAYPKVERSSSGFPVALGGTWSVAGIRVAGPQLSILVVVPVLAIVLGWFLGRTLLGKAVTAAADNPELARTSGINPKLISTLVWSIAGVLATVSIVLIAGKNGSATDLASLGPASLVRALAAAVIAGMASFKRALAAGVAIGVLEALVGFNYLNQTGLIDAILLVAVLIAVAYQSRQQGVEAQAFSFTPKARAIPERLRQARWVRLLDRSGLLLMGLIAVVLPLVVTQPSRHLLYATILAFAICALSVSVLTGWAGQLSLGQMAFAGIGALSAASLHRGLSVDIGWGSARLVKAATVPMPFWLSIVAGTLIAAAVAALIGVGALRVRGLLLAVSTFAFALAAQQYIYRRPILIAKSSTTVPFRRGDLLGLDVSSQRTYYYVVLAILAVVVVVVGRLRSSGVGRTTIGVRDNPDAAAAYTVNAARTKLKAFALAGGLAGLGGALLAGTVQNVPFTERFFLVNDSLVLVAIVVIGGLGSTSGAILGAVWVVGLPAFAPDNPLVPLLTSSLGLLVLLLYFPGGLAQIGFVARDAILRWADRRLGDQPTKTRTTVPAPPARPGRHQIDLDTAALEADGIVVRFGGNCAVDSASVRVGAGEIVGLIGTNGAGKSTLMNAIGGYLPAQGTVRLLGRDITTLAPDRRARLGLGRTFQAAKLFPELTVLDSVMIALEGRGHTRALPTALFWPGSARKERSKRSDASDLIDFLGLGRYADRTIAELSTGTRRIVELAGLLALDARVLCLDEPTAGVAQRETEAFGPLIVGIRNELGASMLVIEHDMPLIMGISDRVYCLEAGRVIAEGDPAFVRNNPRVIASYLGTDERAIARSGNAADR